MATCISQVYCDPAECLPYETREGGYQGTVFDLNDLFWMIGFDVSDDTLRDDIYESFELDYWAKRDWQLLDPHQRLAYGWDRFAKAVKHERRFTFWSMADPDADPHYVDHPDYMPVGTMLDRIADAVTQAGVLRTFPTDTPLWRVRVHNTDEKLNSDDEFGAPPTNYATQPNRMSPAGVSMFYGSEDFDTAVAETLDSSRVTGKSVSGGCFYPVRSLVMLDLFDLPRVPSFFDIAAAEIRHSLIFLKRFAQTISESIIRDGREYIEYVPTQAFSEYVRYQMAADDGTAIDGIRFVSSKKVVSVKLRTFDQAVSGGWKVGGAGASAASGGPANLRAATPPRLSLNLAPVVLARVPIHAADPCPGTCACSNASRRRDAVLRR